MKKYSANFSVNDFCTRLMEPLTGTNKQKLAKEIRTRAWLNGHGSWYVLYDEHSDPVMQGEV